MPDSAGHEKVIIGDILFTSTTSPMLSGCHISTAGEQEESQSQDRCDGATASCTTEHPKGVGRTLSAALGVPPLPPMESQANKLAAGMGLPQVELVWGGNSVKSGGGVGPHPGRGSSSLAPADVLEVSALTASGQEYPKPWNLVHSPAWMLSPGNLLFVSSSSSDSGSCSSSSLPSRSSSLGRDSSWSGTDTPLVSPG